MNNQIKIGVGIIVKNLAQQILLGKRNANYLKGFWAIPAGHVEVGETFTDAARRELLEEVGIVSKQLVLIGINNYFDKQDDKQYINIDFLVENYSGTAQNLEPRKFTELGWFDTNGLPKPLAPPTMIALECFSTKQLCITEPHPFLVREWK